MHGSPWQGTGGVINQCRADERCNGQGHCKCPRLRSIHHPGAMRAISTISTISTYLNSINSIHTTQTNPSYHTLPDTDIHTTHVTRHNMLYSIEYLHIDIHIPYSYILRHLWWFLLGLKLCVLHLSSDQNAFVFF